MKTSCQWFTYFEANLKQKRIDWTQAPELSRAELDTIRASMQAWQLGETSEGAGLLRAATQYANKRSDPFYVKAIELFIKEEQKHGNNLGIYLDLHGVPRIKQNWGDSLFRWFRHFNTSMEMWTLTVITVESAAQVYYQALKDATGCPLLKQICTDILIDEAAHITFQVERMQNIFEHKRRFFKPLALTAYTVFYFCTSWVVWLAHRGLLQAGGNSFAKFHRKMVFKFKRNFMGLGKRPVPAAALQTV